MKRACLAAFLATACLAACGRQAQRPEAAAPAPPTPASAMAGTATASAIEPAILKRLRPALEHDPADIVVNPRSQKTVVAFLDYRCGKCKASAPALYALVERRPDVRLIIKQYPYWGGFSETAAAVMSTPAARSKGLPLHRQLMSEIRLDDAVLRRRLTEAGVDADAAFAEAKNLAVRQHMDQTKTLVTELHIEGTPAFVVGRTLISGPDISQVEAALPRS